MPESMIILLCGKGPMQTLHEKSGGQFDQIGALAAIAGHGSFAAAARVLDRKPSVLSRRIDALERRLEVRLFAQTTREIGPTEVGAVYLQTLRMKFSTERHSAFRRQWIGLPLLPTLSEVTVKVHRANAMQKMQAPSLPALVRMSDALGADMPES